MQEVYLNTEISGQKKIRGSVIQTFCIACCKYSLDYFFSESNNLISGRYNFIYFHPILGMYSF